MRCWIYILIFVASGFTAFGQVSAPKYSNEFLNIGVGARGLAMGGAQNALADDVTAGYWNPAGLVWMDDTLQVALMHSEQFAGIAKYDYVSIGTKLDSLSRLAVTIIRLGVDDIPDTRFLFDANGSINYDNIRFFSASDYAFMLSYAGGLKSIDSLTYGATVKVIYRSAGNFATAWGFGIDAGLRYHIGDWRLGALLKDGTGTFNTWFVNTSLLEDVFQQTGNAIPDNSLEVTLPSLILGGARSWTIKEKWGISAGLDLVSTFDGKRNVLLRSNFASIEPRVGLEADLKQMVFLRMGATGFQQVKNFEGDPSWQFMPSFGLGIRIRSFDIDYALTDVFDVSDALYSNVFSVKFRFSGS